MSFTIEIHDKDVTTALNNLLRATSDLSPFLMALGDDIIERTKQRFETATAPDGIPWAPNSPVTLARKKAGKRPLQGESGDLARQFYPEVSENELIVSNTMKYAAVQQYGAIQGEFGRDQRNHPIPWGDIPARPFMPITPMGDLYPEEKATIVDLLNRYFQEAITI